MKKARKGFLITEIGIQNDEIVNNRILRVIAVQFFLCLRLVIGELCHDAAVESAEILPHERDRLLHFGIGMRIAGGLCIDLCKQRDAAARMPEECEQDSASAGEYERECFSFHDDAFLSEMMCCVDLIRHSRRFSVSIRRRSAA